MAFCFFVIYCAKSVYLQRNLMWHVVKIFVSILPPTHPYIIVCIAVSSSFFLVYKWLVCLFLTLAFLSQHSVMSSWVSVQVSSPHLCSTSNFKRHLIIDAPSTAVRFSSQFFFSDFHLFIQFLLYYCYWIMWYKVTFQCKIDSSFQNF